MMRWQSALILVVVLAGGCGGGGRMIVAPAETVAPPPSLVTEPVATPEETGAKPVVTTIDNGVTIAVLEDHETPVVALRVYVRTGSMHEQEFLGAGVSHFLEHLVAGGTTSKRTEAEVQKISNSIGAQANAYTTRDHTCYYMSTASRFFDTALDLLADATMNAAITPEEWQREYEVIQREMETRRTNPMVVLTEAMDHILFTVFPARVPVIGYRDAFKALTRDDVYAYYTRTYRPDNLLVVVAGDVKAEEAVAKAAAAFGAMPHRASAPIALPAEPRQVAPRRVEKEMQVGQAYLMLSWRTIPLTHPDLYALDLLSYVLSSGESSRLVRRLRDEQGLVTSIGTASDTPGYDGGEFLVYATTDPAKLAEAERAIHEEIRLAREELVSDEELRTAKRQKISDHVFGRQTVEAQAAGLGIDILAAFDPEFDRNYTTRIQQTTREEIREAARRYLTDDRVCAAVVRPPRGATEAQPGEAKAAGSEAVRKTVLPNGLTLLVRRNPRLPIVSMQAFFLGGLRAEPEGKNGVSAFTARMLTRGTETRTAEQIAEAFDRMGGSIGGGSGNNSIYLSAACLAENQGEAMEIFADVLAHPSFPEAEIERMRPPMIAAAESREDDWHTELSEAFQKRWYPTHPYRNPTGGTPETLRGLTRDDLVGFHKSSFIASGAVVAVYGAVDPAAVEATVGRLFGGWPHVDAKRAPLPTDPPPTEDRVERVTGKSDIGGVLVGFPGTTLVDAKDRYAMDVLDAVLSGVNLPRGWLHETLRGKGLVYEVHAYNFVGIEPGYFGIYAGCEPGRAEEVRNIILEQVARIFKEEIPEEDLKAARQTCITADVLDRQTNSDQGMRNALDELYGLGYDFSRGYEEGILAVTGEEVRRVAEKYLTHSLSVLMTPGDDKSQNAEQGTQNKELTTEN